MKCRTGRQSKRRSPIDAEIRANRLQLDAAIALLTRTITTLRATSRRTMLEYKAAAYLLRLNSDVVDADCQFRKFQNQFDEMFTRPGTGAADGGAQ